MVINWDYVKERTLWSYEDLIKKLQRTLGYRFVQEQYNHSMDDAIDYVNMVQAGYLQHRGDRKWLDDLITNFTWLRRAGIQNYQELIDAVADREQCERFLYESGLGFPELIDTLNYLLRWVLPFPTPLREFIDTRDSTQMAYYERLKARRMTMSLDLLEQGRTAAQRTQLAAETAIPADFLLALVHKSDLSRLAYVRGKTIGHLCGGGYDTLAKLANADLPEMEAAMRVYYTSIGKRFEDFKSVVPLEMLVGGARILPLIVET